MADGSPPDSFERFKLQPRPLAPPPSSPARSGSPLLNALGAGFSAVAGGVGSGFGAVRGAMRAASGARYAEEAKESDEEREERLASQALEEAATDRRNELMREVPISAMEATSELNAAIGSQRQELKHAYEARVEQLEQQNFLRGLEAPLTEEEVQELLMKKAAILDSERPGGKLSNAVEVFKLRRFDSVQQAYTDFLDAYDHALETRERGPELERLREIRERVVPGLLRAMDKSETEIAQTIGTMRRRNEGEKEAQGAALMSAEPGAVEEWGLQFSPAGLGGQGEGAAAPGPSRHSYVRRPSRKQRGGKRKTQKSKTKRSKRSTRRRKH